jgi:hypothetical protein
LEEADQGDDDHDDAVDRNALAHKEKEGEQSEAEQETDQSSDNSADALRVPAFALAHLSPVPSARNIVVVIGDPPSAPSRRLFVILVVENSLSRLSRHAVLVGRPAARLCRPIIVVSPASRAVLIFAPSPSWTLVVIVPLVNALRSRF